MPPAKSKGEKLSLRVAGLSLAVCRAGPGGRPLPLLPATHTYPTAGRHVFPKASRCLERRKILPNKDLCSLGLWPRPTGTLAVSTTAIKTSLKRSEGEPRFRRFA